MGSNQPKRFKSMIDEVIDRMEAEGIVTDIGHEATQEIDNQIAEGLRESPKKERTRRRYADRIYLELK